MSYAKQTHVAGQKLTAAQLNHMENGIVAAHNAYNLLDNSDFTNPINQRGQTTYTGRWNYSIDRWMTATADATEVVVAIEQGGITFTTNNNCSIFLLQRIAKGVLDNTKSYTIAAYLADGKIQISGNYIDKSSSNYDVVNIVIASGTKIKYVVMYEGTYSADTLPAYQYKGYAAELAECQRYYQQYSVVGLTCRNNGYATTLLPVTMRVAPTISVGARRLYTTSYEDASGAYPNTLSANTTSIFFSNYFYEGFVTITCNDVTLSADL